MMATMYTKDNEWSRDTWFDTDPFQGDDSGDSWEESIMKVFLPWQKPNEKATGLNQLQPTYSFPETENIQHCDSEHIIRHQ